MKVSELVGVCPICDSFLLNTDERICLECESSIKQAADALWWLAMANFEAFAEAGIILEDDGA